MGEAAIPNRDRLPSILLARKPRFADIRNETTATACSKHGGYTMAVSFWMEDPPHLSFFSVHCTKPPHDLSQGLGFKVIPHVVGADGPFVLFRAAFDTAAGGREYFLYKAGPPPSLVPIPSPGKLDTLRGVRELGILGYGGSGHYLLAALRDAPSRESDDGYQILIYSSETESWSTRTLQNPCPGVDRVMPDKVITLVGLQEGLLAWVDLSRGLLVCDLHALLRHDLVSCFIPLPEPLPGNKYKLKYPFAPTRAIKGHHLADEASRSASWFRDLACVNGVLKFVEMENHPAPRPKTKEDNIIHDADLIKSLKREAQEGVSSLQLSSFRDAWRAVTWTRKLAWPPSSCPPSNFFWSRRCAAHVADMSKGPLLLKQLYPALPFPSLEDGGAFEELYSAFPILSPEDGDDDIIYLKSLREPSDKNGWVTALDIGNKAVKAIGTYYLPDDFWYHPLYDSEHPFHASTLSCHLDITPGTEVSAFPKIPEATSSANHASNTPVSISQRLPEAAGTIKRPRNLLKSIIQSRLISQAHPVENRSQQGFNKPNGPCDPGYATLAPVVHGDHTYQPLWTPSKHQLTSSNQFKPQEAPQTCFNNYHGYSQQLFAPNPFAYGAHTGNGSYQQQWPIAWQQPPPTVQRQPTP